MRFTAPPPKSGTPSARPPRAGAVIAALSVLAVLSAVLLALVAAEWAPLLAYDREVADVLHRKAVKDPGFARLNRVLSDWVWDPWTMRIMLALATGWLWWRGERVLAGWVVVTGVVGTVVQQGLKAAVGRDRPRWPDPVDSAHYAAFPSGHAMTAVVAFGLLLWLLRRFGARAPVWRAALAVAAVSVVGVGVTRLYLGVHWFSDVVGGWLLGALVVALSVTLYERCGSGGVRGGSRI
ncbi:phosphatase PAP2 family protein [Streptomyces sp. A3M-1-3]|uniref:phosphatase PAP2 family protein n=1 Tax=Streptomyces sp. A3M-1-3 TaxID=2962044 RepID=UPI0020B737C2|nr:phosphatase PAP2 family protein [Streptomyces sp. A3M-1-3]MCP3818729.1 phosphatase PAP2 family protein [Streptomyces sp. A3M-1-3]